MKKMMLLSALALASVASSAHAYQIRFENTTSGTIKVSLKLTAGPTIEVGSLKPGETSKIFDSGAYCFESARALGVNGAVNGVDSGAIFFAAPDETAKAFGIISHSLCFKNLHVKFGEVKKGDQVRAIDMKVSDL